MIQAPHQGIFYPNAEWKISQNCALSWKDDALILDDVLSRSSRQLLFHACMFLRLSLVADSVTVIIITWSLDDTPVFYVGMETCCFHDCCLGFPLHRFLIHQTISMHNQNCFRWNSILSFTWDAAVSCAGWHVLFLLQMWWSLFKVSIWKGWNCKCV